MPAALLQLHDRDDHVTPAWLGEVDHPWLGALLDARAGFVGRRQRELAERLAEGLDPPAPRRARALASLVLDRLAGADRPAGPDPRALRAALFTAAAGGAPRDQVVAAVAAAHELTADRLEELLFDDLPDERRVGPLPASLGAPALAARCNLALVQGLLARVDTLRLELTGDALPLVRHAHRRGLIVTVPHVGADGATLELSGPLALFHHTVRYGRALADLVPALGALARFRLVATCVLPRGPVTLAITSDELILPPPSPERAPPADARLAAALRRAVPTWELIRDPEPLRAGPGLVLPDYALVDPADPGRRWLLEVVGFWTPTSVERKLAAYRALGGDRVILCLDDRRRCADGDLPPGARVVWMRRTLDPRALRALLDGDQRPPR